MGGGVFRFPKILLVETKIIFWTIIIYLVGREASQIYAPRTPKWYK